MKGKEKGGTVFLEQTRSCNPVFGLWAFHCGMRWYIGEQWSEEHQSVLFRPLCWLDGAYGFSPLQTIGSLIINHNHICLLAALPGELVGTPLLNFYPLSNFFSSIYEVLQLFEWFSW